MKHQFTSQVIISIEHQTVQGPRGLKLELDAGEIYPSDPGMGTPRLVKFGRDTMTFDCAMDNINELVGQDFEWAMKWIHSLEEKAGLWLDYHHNIAERLAS